MARPTDVNITLPLLDRLTDYDPKRSEEAPLSRSEAMAELKTAVRRDLEWLLNTRRIHDKQLPERVSKSVLFYGLQEYSEVSEDKNQALHELAKRIELTLSTYEPRLADVRVRLAPHQDHAARRIALIIDGLLRVDPSPEQVSFDANLELTSGEYHVKGESSG